MFPRLILALLLAYFISSVVALTEKFERNVRKCFVDDPEIQKLDEGKRIYLERSLKSIMRATTNFRTEGMIREMMYDIVEDEKSLSGIGLSAGEMATIAGDCFVAEVEKLVNRTPKPVSGRM